MSFESLGLSAPLIRAISEQGYITPTPIQIQAIPEILNGKDILGGAQTGTGKTASFTLPLIQILCRHKPVTGFRPVRGLILTPTRELAAQVGESVRVYGKHSHLRSTTLFGGVKIGPQIAKLKRGVDIIVATPGRLLDHLSQKTVDLSQVEILVLDEADRILDMGFILSIRKLLTVLPHKRQNLLFSATYSREIKKLADDLLKKPVVIEVDGGNSPASKVKQLIHPVDSDRKQELLSHLIRSNGWHQVLVFTRTRHGANRLTKNLKKSGVDADVIHGEKSQGARKRALSNFKENKIQALVATDIAARGLDIETLPYVVNYELPNSPEDYVHRIGRTGRAGKEGEAISLVCVDELDYIRDIEKLLGKEVPREIIPGFEPDPSIKPVQINQRKKSSGTNSRNPRNSFNKNTGQRKANSNPKNWRSKKPNKRKSFKKTFSR